MVLVILPLVVRLCLLYSSNVRIPFWFVSYNSKSSMVGQGIVNMWQNESSHSWISFHDRPETPSFSHSSNAFWVRAVKAFSLIWYPSCQKIAR